MAQKRRVSERMVDGLAVTIEHKRIKNVYLRVLPPDGRVYVSAPLDANEAALEAFVRARRDWLDKRRAAYADYRPRGYETGEAVRLFDETLTLRVVECAGRAKLERCGGTLVLSIRPESGMEARKRALEAFLREALLVEARRLLPECERTVGRRAGGLRVREMKSRWGSCNVQTGAVTLNLRLIEKPRVCLGYVLTHELCHLHIPGHGKDFWRLMDGFFPAWRQTRRLLRG